MKLLWRKNRQFRGAGLSNGVVSGAGIHELRHVIPVESYALAHLF
jgi:hypothetical protein